MLDSLCTSMHGVLLLLIASCICRRALARRTEKTLERDWEGGRCCCDILHYSPPQCLLLSKSELEPGFFGQYCPSMDIFPGDGVGIRVLNEEPQGAGCNASRGEVAALGLKEEMAKGNAMHMAVPEHIRFLVLAAEDEETEQKLDEKEEAEERRRRSVLLMSNWRLALHRKVMDTVTSRAVYQLSLESEASTFSTASHTATLPLTRVRRVIRRDVDGRAGVELELQNGKRLFLVPFNAMNAWGPIADLPLSVDASTLTRWGWSLRSALGITGGQLCCCKLERRSFLSWHVGDQCALAPGPSCGKNAEAVPAKCPAVQIGDSEQVAAAEELAAQIAKAKRIATGGSAAAGEESGQGARVLYETFSSTDFRCHSEGQLKEIVQAGWTEGIGAELRTFKALQGGSGAGGISGFVRDVFGRHQHLMIGSGESCVDLVRDGAQEMQLRRAGCEPYQAKAAITATVRECLDTVAAVERANLRAWGVMARAYIRNSNLLAPLEAAGYTPAASWQRLLAEDVDRVEQLRLAALSMDMQADRAGVWHILQRASIYAQKFFDEPDVYLQNLDRKLDDVDKLFWEFMQKPGDMHVYPHMYNQKDPRDVVESLAYQALVRDNETFTERIMPAFKEADMEPTPQAVSQVVGECVRSLKCAEPPLLFLLMQSLGDERFWNKVPVGWLAGLAHAPKMYPKPPSKSKLLFPRSTRVVFRQCFTAPHQAIVDERKFMARLEEQVDGKTWLRKFKTQIFEPSDWPVPPTLESDEVLNRIQDTLEASTGLYVEDLASAGVQGALACYPTLFGSLGMEKEIRDETGYDRGGKRTKDMEEVWGRCHMAPQCGRLAIERLLHFNTKRWDQYANVASTFASLDSLCRPNPDQTSNCQVFAKCFQHELDSLCQEFPGCCGGNSSSTSEGATPQKACSTASWDLVGDVRAVLGW